MLEEHKQNRVCDSHRILELEQSGELLTYLDEKYFFCFSGCKLVKHLRRAEFEEDGVNRIRIRRVMNKLHPVKTMFMGIITAPVPEHDFDRKINMKR